MDKEREDASDRDGDLKDIENLSLDAWQGQQATYTDWPMRHKALGGTDERQNASELTTEYDG